MQHQKRRLLFLPLSLARPRCVVTLCSGGKRNRGDVLGSSSMGLNGGWFDTTTTLGCGPSGSLGSVILIDRAWFKRRLLTRRPPCIGETILNGFGVSAVILVSGRLIQVGVLVDMTIGEDGSSGVAKDSELELVLSSAAATAAASSSRIWAHWANCRTVWYKLNILLPAAAGSSSSELVCVQLFSV